MKNKKDTYKKKTKQNSNHYDIKFYLPEELRNIVTCFIENYLISILQENKHTFKKYENPNMFSNHIQNEDIREQSNFFVDSGFSEGFSLYYFETVGIFAISLNYKCPLSFLTKVPLASPSLPVLT